MSKSRAFFPSQWCLKFVQWVKGISDSLECLCQWPRSKKRLVKCERKVCFNANGRFMFLICEWVLDYGWVSLGMSLICMYVEFKHITYVNVYMYVYNVALLFLLEHLFVCSTGTPPMCTRPMIMTMGWCIPPRMKDPTLVDTPLWRRVGELPSEGQTQWCWGQDHPQG